MRTQDAGTIMQSLKWNHQHQDPFHGQPPISMFQKDGFHTPVRNRADFGVVGRVQIEERKGLWLYDRVKRIVLNYLDPARAGDAGAFGIEFDSVASNRRIAGDQVECSTLADAWVDYRCRFRIDQKRAEFQSFALG